MNLNEYQRLAHKTSRFANSSSEVLNEITMATLGLVGETGEVADYIKKWLYHDHPQDTTKLAEELGDVLWYIAELCSALGMDLNTIAVVNIEKLKQRYGDAFSSEASINRSE